jgi:hypothetical protein
VAEGNYKVEEDTCKVKVKGRTVKEEAIAAILGELDYY